MSASAKNAFLKGLSPQIVGGEVIAHIDGANHVIGKVINDLFHPAEKFEELFAQHESEALGQVLNEAAPRATRAPRPPRAAQAGKPAPAPVAEPVVDPIPVVDPAVVDPATADADLDAALADVNSLLDD